ncbi:MAG TPA: hypothetical protein VFH45_10430, partial [Acidimicrobiales bacterium]|nr:hypothetical protein [Acidimicrobiales bacterium]
MTTTAPTRTDSRWRDRVLPRSMFGLVSLILAAAVGAAFSGTVLFAYYSYELNKTNQRVASYVNGFDQRYKTAISTVQAETANGQAQIQKSLQPLIKVQAAGTQLSDTLSKASPAVYFVHTLDDAGQPAVGTAFVVASDNNQSLLITSYTTVQAATRRPGPAVTLEQNNVNSQATLWTWDPTNDLALLILTKSNQPKLNFAPPDPPLHL